MMPSDGRDCLCMLSFDVEDWFQVERFRPVIDPDSWDEYELRVVPNIERLLWLLEDSGTRATFFVLGWVAERVPALVARVKAAGHEIASHGCNHRPLHEMSEAELERDVVRSKELLEDITGEQVIGYRAPRFSIMERLPDILHRHGFRYDSSLYPSTVTRQYARIGLPVNPSFGAVSRYPNGLLEVPVSTLRVLGKCLPWGGGGYFRFYPYWLFRIGVRTVQRRQGAYLFYSHPWELDAQQPRLRSVSWLDRTLHYGYIDAAESKLERLLNDFRFTSIADGLERAGFV